MTALQMKLTQELDKKKIARSFLRGHSTYDSHAKIQYKVSQYLVDKLSQHHKISYDRVLEIGCCTGNLTELLLRNFNIESLYLNDLVPHFHKHVSRRVSPIKQCEIIPLFGDIEELVLPDALDLIVSSATFQWLTDLPQLFKRISHALKPDGYLAFSIFGPGTLREFKDITGIGLEYSAVGKILDMLEENFHIEEEITTKDQLFLSSPKDVLRHLQATGVGGVQDFRWTPGKLRQFDRNYAEKYGSPSGVPVTYMSSYIIAAKRR